MADNENVTIRIRVNADTKEIDKVQRRLAALCAQADACEKRFRDLADAHKDFDDRLDKSGRKLRDFNDDLDDHGKKTKDSDDRTKRLNKRLKDSDDRMNRLGRNARRTGNIFSKVFSLAIKGAALETIGLIAALSSVNLLLRTGQALSRAWTATVNALGIAAANAAAGIFTAVALFTQAQRQFAAAQASANYGGDFRSSSRALRMMQTDATLATFGLQSLTGAFSAASKNARVTGTTVQSLRGLADFAVASGDMEKGLAAAANLVSLLQAGKAAGGEEVLTAAGELGPQFEKAFKEVLKTGGKTNEELLKMFASGELAEAAGVSGTSGNVRGTLMGQLKAFATEMQTIFADIGQTFIGPVQEAFHQIRNTIRRFVIEISGSLSNFARGNFIDFMVGAFEKLTGFLATLINEWLPRTDEFLDRFVDKWGRMTNWFGKYFQIFSQGLKKFSETSSRVNEFLGTILRAIGSGVGDNFRSLAELIDENNEAFQEFGRRLGDLIAEIFNLFGEIRKVFFDALPAINAILGGITSLVHGFTELLSVLRAIPGSVSSIIGLMLAGGLLPGRAGKGARGAIGRVPVMAGVGAMAAGAGVAGLGGMIGGTTGNIVQGAGMGIVASPFLRGALAQRAASVGAAAPGMMRLGAAGAIAGAGLVGTDILTRKMAENGWSTAGTAAGGALAGAVTGAMVGSILPGVGTAIGAAAGLVIGGVVGFVNSNKVKNASKDNGRKFAEIYGDGIKSALQAGGIDEAKRLRDEYEAELIKFANTTNNQEEIYQAGLEEKAKIMEELNPAIDQFDRNLADLARISGRTDDELIALAQSLDIDLSSNLMTVTELITEMGIAVGKFGTDFDAAMNGVFADATANMETALQKVLAPQAITEAQQNYVELVKTGEQTAEDTARFMQDIITQTSIATGGDALRTYLSLTRNIGSSGAPGLQFQAGGSLEGTQSDFFKYGFWDDFMAESTAGLVTQLTDNAVSIMAEQGYNVNRSQMMEAIGRMGAEQGYDSEQFAYLAAELAAGRMPQFGPNLGSFSQAAAASLMRDQDPEFVRRALAETTGLAQAGLRALQGQWNAGNISPEGFSAAALNLFGMQGAQGFLEALGMEQAFETTFGTQITVQQSENDRFLDALPDEIVQGVGEAFQPLEDAMITFNENINALVDAVKGDSGDTFSPRRNLVDTMSSHRKFDMMLSGRRTVTSAFRTSGLGSGMSDHAAGRAYDLIGQNLGGYKSLILASGGYADFHGAGGSRHLHVVPPQGGPVGDTATPSLVGGGMAMAGGSSSNDSYTINVYASEGMNEQQVATMVMERIRQANRDARERS